MVDESICPFQKFCPNDVIMDKAQKGTTLFMPEQRASFVYHLHDGIIALFYMYAPGEERTHALLTPRSIFGMNSLGKMNAGERMDHVTQARAMTSIVYCKVKAEAIWNMLDNREARAEFFDLMIDRMRLMGMLTAIPFKRDIEARILTVVQVLAETIGKPISGGPIHIDNVTQDDIAAITGTTRPTVTRILGELARHGLIETGRRSIVLVDPSSLRFGELPIFR